MDPSKLGKVQNSPRRFSEVFKRKVCEEYLSTGLNKTHLMAKYDIKGKSAILDWLRRYGYINETADSAKTVRSMKNEEDTSNEGSLLHHQIKELEAQLEREKLEKEALRVLIEIAEREYKLDIRKK